MVKHAELVDHVMAVGQDVESLRVEWPQFFDLSDKKPDSLAAREWDALRLVCRRTKRETLTAQTGYTPATKFGEHVVSMLKNSASAPSAPSYETCLLTEPRFERALQFNTDPLVVIRHNARPVGAMKLAGETTILGIEDVPEIGIMKGVVSGLSSPKLGAAIGDTARQGSGHLLLPVSDIEAFGASIVPIRMSNFMLDKNIVANFQAAMPETYLCTIDDVRRMTLVAAADATRPKDFKKKVGAMLTKHLKSYRSPFDQ